MTTHQNIVIMLISFTTNKLHNKFHIPTHIRDYTNMFQLFVTAIFGEHGCKKHKYGVKI